MSMTSTAASMVIASDASSAPVLSPVITQTPRVNIFTELPMCVMWGRAGIASGRKVPTVSHHGPPEMMTNRNTMPWFADWRLRCVWRKQ